MIGRYLLLLNQLILSQYNKCHHIYLREQSNNNNPNSRNNSNNNNNKQRDHR